MSNFRGSVQKITHTIASQARTEDSKRQFYSLEFRLQTIWKCGETGAPIAAVALKQGINADIVHRWLHGHSRSALVIQSTGFVPVTLSEAVPVPVSPPDSRIEVQRANTTIVMK